MISNILRGPLLAATLTLPFSLPATTMPVDAEAVTVVRDLAAIMDENHDGSITRSEVELFSQFAQVFMDSDSNGLMERSEFMQWDAGFQWLADLRGIKATYIQAKNTLFSEWDLNSDGSISRKEMLDVANVEFAATDTDQDLRINGIDLLLGSRTVVTLADPVKRL